MVETELLLSQIEQGYEEKTPQIDEIHEEK